MTYNIKIKSNLHSHQAMTCQALIECLHDIRPCQH